mmetsp:Transcript_16532/g.18388  ORF Transcript_16532/g.18388 Transcript_16532/m.18388 type:complete len:202 (-) Transcript_16532:337-942(-)
MSVQSHAVLCLEPLLPPLWLLLPLLLLLFLWLLPWSCRLKLQVRKSPTAWFGQSSWWLLECLLLFFVPSSVGHQFIGRISSLCGRHQAQSSTLTVTVMSPSFAMSPQSSVYAVTVMVTAPSLGSRARRLTRVAHAPTVASHEAGPATVQFSKAPSTSCPVGEMWPITDWNSAMSATVRWTASSSSALVAMEIVPAAASTVM